MQYDNHQQFIIEYDFCNFYKNINEQSLLLLFYALKKKSIKWIIFKVYDLYIIKTYFQLGKLRLRRVKK